MTPSQHSQYTSLATAAQALARRIVEALSCGRPQCPCARARRVGYGLTHCPGHTDERPSLAVRVVGDRVVVHCHARCAQERVIDALAERGLWPPAARETRYTVRDADGTPVAVHVRLDGPEGKRMWWTTPDGRLGLGGARVEELPLYGVHRLRDATEVIVTEGEKAADALIGLGLPAVGTVTGAAATPGDAALRPLVGRTVYVWPDADDAGRAHMRRVAERLHRLGRSDIRIVEWPDAPDGGDAADLVARGGTTEDVRRLLADAELWRPDDSAGARATPADDAADAHVPDEGTQPSTQPERERRSQADRLIGYALASGARFLLDQFGQPHVLVEGAPLALPRGAYPWLRRLMWEHEHRGITGEALQAAAGTLEAFALHEGERRELHVRSAWHEQSLWVWLGPGRILHIDAAGWRVEHDAPVLYRRYPTLQELPDPAVGTTVDSLSDCLDLVAPRDRVLRRLVTAWIVLAWLPHIARPILLFTGDWGAGKTLRQRVIKRLLDPTKPESIRLDPREIVQKLAHCQVALLDNLGSIPEWAIDTLCRAVTGEGDSKRRLYTDEDDVVFEFRRAILLNGINPPADRPDFTDRLLPVELERIPDDRRQEEAAIWTQLAARHAVWLGAIATLLSRAMQAYPAIQAKRLPRLADWGRWAMAVYEAMGWGAAQFERDWASVVERQQSAAVEGSPVAQALLRWMDTRESWRGTASELLSELEPVADELSLARAKGWPKSPVWLARRLRELRPVLADRGIVATEQREHGGTRVWIIRRSEDGPQIPSPPSPDGRFANLDADFSGDSTGGGTVTVPSPQTRYRHPSGDSKPGAVTVNAGYRHRENPHTDANGDGGDAGDSIFGTSSEENPCPTCGAEMRPLEGDGWECSACGTAYWPPAAEG